MCDCCLSCHACELIRCADLLHAGAGQRGGSLCVHVHASRACPGSDHGTTPPERQSGEPFVTPISKTYIMQLKHISASRQAVHKSAGSGRCFGMSLPSHACVNAGEGRQLQCEGSVTPARGRGAREPHNPQGLLPIPAAHQHLRAQAQEVPSVSPHRDASPSGPRLTQSSGEIIT